MTLVEGPLPDVRADRERLTDLLARLVRTESVNPSLDPSGAGEADVAALLAEEARTLGMEVDLLDAGPARTSVIATLPGMGGGRSLMLNGHIDTVSISGMADALSGRIERGRLYGRGAYDMKGGVAACFGAVRALRDAGVRLAGDLVISAVADEEFESLGIQQAVRVRPTDAAIVTEPTALRTCVAHKGFVWVGVEARGRAAHGSRPDLGADANRAMARLIAALEPLHAELSNAPPHRLLGRGSFHVGTLLGGSGVSTYAERCEATLERRTVPGESARAFLDAVTIAADQLQARDARVEYVVRELLVREPFEAAEDSAIVASVQRARAAMLGAAAAIGDSVWMDAAILHAHGIDTVVIGPTGAGAHAAEEWVDVESVVQLTEILARAAIDYCGPVAPSGPTGAER